MYALVDCNNFFVSCERLFRPGLRSKPVAVLSNNDGCFISRSQEVKDIGLPMGAPVFKYKQAIKANDVTLFSANFELYGDMSQRIISVLRSVTPLIEVYSIDECFVDLSQLAIDDHQTWAVAVRERIFQEVGIPVSIGIAPTKTLAKVASTASKKRGGALAIDTDDKRLELLQDLPIEDIWGVGRQLAPKLKDKGVSMALQLVNASDGWLKQQFTIVGIKMVDELRGIARLPFGDSKDTRGQIMRSRSFGHRVRAYHQLESAVSTFAAQASVKLREQNSLTHKIVVFLSTGKHAMETKHASTDVVLIEPTQDTARIITAALEGLHDIYDGDFAYMKAGVILHDLTDIESWQLSFMSNESRRDERTALMQSMDSINKQYGTVIWHASEKPIDADWHSKKKLRSPRYTCAWDELPILRG